MKLIKSFRKLWKDDLWGRNYGLQRMVKVTKNINLKKQKDEQNRLKWVSSGQAILI